MPPQPQPRVINRLEDGIYHISTQHFYRRPHWFLDRIKLNQAHIVLYRNGLPIARIVPMDAQVSPCEADYGLPAFTP